MSTASYARPHTPLLIVISGLPGAGKDSVLRRLKERHQPFYFVVTATSRAPRPGEEHGRDYFFLTEAEFEKMLAHDELLEHALVYNQHKGVPKQQVRTAMASGLDVIMRVDVQGAAKVRALTQGQAVLIFISTASEEEMRQRLRRRQTETPEALQVRLATARQELAHLDEFDYCVVNRDGELDRTVDDVIAIIQAEHCRVQPRQVSL